MWLLADCDVDAANMYLLFNQYMMRNRCLCRVIRLVIDYDLCTSCALCMNYRFDAISEDREE